MSRGADATESTSAGTAACHEAAPVAAALDAAAPKPAGVEPVAVLAADTAETTSAADTARRASAIGPLLPGSTEAESGRAWGDTDEVSDEDWLREVPPHHG